MRGTLALLFVLACACGLLANLHHIHDWERAAGYPFGRMCDSFFTGYADTCKR